MSPKNSLFSKGNNDFLRFPKIGVLASRNILPGFTQAVIESINRLSKLKILFISGWHSPIEKEIHEFLVKKEKSHIHVGAKTVDRMFCRLNKEKVLFISHCHSRITRITRENALKRNNIVCKLSEVLLIPWLDSKGKTYKLVFAYCKNKPVFIFDKEYNAELIKCGACLYNYEKVISFLEKNNANN